VIGDGARDRAPADAPPRVAPDDALGWWVDALVDSDSFTVDFVERAPIERLSQLFDPLRVDSTG
jgi:hypothetical protein